MSRFANEVNPPLEQVLQHFGVKGMRWGVRKDRILGREPDKSGVTRRQASKQRKEIARKADVKLYAFETLPLKQRNEEIKKA
jgi:hypothetical protein